MVSWRAESGAALFILGNMCVQMLEVDDMACDHMLIVNPCIQQEVIVGAWNYLAVIAAEDIIANKAKRI